MSMTPEEKAQIDAEYEKIEKSFKERGVHEIVLKTMSLLVAEEGIGWRDQWTPELAAEWWKELEAAKAAGKIRMALDDLLMLAAYFQTKLNKLNLTMGLVILINEAVNRYKLVDFAVDAKFEQQVGSSASVTGGKDRPIPAKVGDRAPEGAVRADQIGKGPRRI